MKARRRASLPPPRGRRVSSYRNPAKRSECIRDVREALLRLRPGLAAEPAEVQRRLSNLAWRPSFGMARHGADPTFSYFPARSLEAEFGRGRFNQLNEKHGIFEVLEADTQPGRWTRGYRLAPDIDAAVNDYLRRVDERLPTLITRDGMSVHTLPRAIASKSKAGRPANAWAAVPLTNSVPVDFDGLTAYSAHLERYARTGGRLVAEQWVPFTAGEMESIRYRERVAARLLGLSNSNLGGRASVPHRYEEIDCGRLCAVGVNLQGAPRDVRAVALHGLWEADLSNAHYSIIMQLAEPLGVELPEVRWYLDNKRAVREALAARVGADAEAIKKCLLAPIYGARSTLWDGGEIVKLLGAAKARKLFADPQFRALKAEVARARAAILRNAGIRQGRVFNALGKSVALREVEGPRKGKRKKPAELLAHIVLGLEALMLKTVIDAHREVVLPRHDGWVAGRELDVGQIEALIRAKTGLNMTVEQVQIEAPEWFQLGKVSGSSSL